METQTRNRDTIELIRTKTKAITEDYQLNRNIEKFNLKDIKIENVASYQNKLFSDDATTTLLNLLNVKPAFKDYQKSMSEKDWETVADKIKKAKGEVEIYGDISHDDIVNNLYIANPNKKVLDDMTNSLNVINTIETELAQSQCDYSLANFNFDPGKYMFDISLRNESDPIDLLGNDPWKTGQNFKFNSLDFKWAPYFERLSCTNGMMKQQFGFQSNISRNNFNNNKFDRIINKALASVNESHYIMLEEFAKRLNATNISLAEFYATKNWSKLSNP